MAETTIVAPKTGARVLRAAEKQRVYGELLPQIQAVVAPERDLLACMASIVCLLHNAIPYFYWTGFYRRVEPRLLRVGPYQGTLGCIDIPFGRGVCGASASEERTMIVPDVTAFPGHIACDAASVSEIVVPAFDESGNLFAVLDVDSTLTDAFDETDARYLETVVALLRGKEAGPVVMRGTPPE